MGSLRTLLMATAAVFTTMLVFNSVEERKALKQNVYEIKSEEYLEVDFMIVTPCLETGECYNFNEEILDITDEFYKDYGIDVDFIEKKVVIEEEESLNVEYSSASSPTYGLALKMELVKSTGIDMPHVLHAPMYANDINNPVLGVANQYLQMIVLDQDMIDSMSVEMEAHVLIHEIGHIFGLPDIYNPKSCNLMDGYSSPHTFLCQRLTLIQVEKMHHDIKLYLNENS